MNEDANKLSSPCWKVCLLCPW